MMDKRQELLLAFLGRVTDVRHANAAGATLAEYAYGYDAADRLTSETVNGVARTYGYDVANQLTNDNGTPHTYDKAGNRTDPGYVTGPGNRLLSDGTWSYTYDDAGNLVKKSKGAAAETWTYSYDAAGQLTAASKSASDGGPATDTVGFAYDAYGNRLTRTAWNASSGTTTERYTYDGWDTAKPDPVGGEAFDADRDLDGANAVTARRLFGPGFDDPLARQDAAGNVAWYGADRLGSVRLVFDNSGTITGARDYAGFGAITASSGSGLDRYAFAGMSWDPTLGMYGTPAGGRWLDPASGRWTAQDPAGFATGDPNLFRYVGNAPTTATDPSGLLKFYKEPGDDYTSVFDDDGRTALGYLVTVGGRSYVARLVNGQWRYLPLEYVEQNEGRLSFHRNTDPDRAHRYRLPGSWGPPGMYGSGGHDRDLALEWSSKHSLGKEDLFGPKPVTPSRRPGESDITDFRGTRMADFPTLTDPEMTVGQAGGPAAATIIAMMEYVAAELAEQLVLKYTGTKLLQFLHHIGSRGWKVILDRRTGKVVKVLTEDGKPVARGDWEAAVKEFETAQERKALPPHTPKEAAPPGNAEPCPPAGKGATTPGKPVPKHVRDPNWKPTWSLEKRTRNVDILTKNMGIGPIEKDGRAAHHIVQATNNKDPSFQKARDLLLEHQIDINSSANGVALQSTKPGARVNPGLRRHAGGDLHTKKP